MLHQHAVDKFIITPLQNGHHNSKDGSIWNGIWIRFFVSDCVARLAYKLKCYFQYGLSCVDNFGRPTSYLWATSHVKALQMRVMPERLWFVAIHMTFTRGACLMLHLNVYLYVADHSNSLRKLTTGDVGRSEYVHDRFTSADGIILQVKLSTAFKQSSQCEFPTNRRGIEHCVVQFIALDDIRNSGRAIEFT